MNCPKCNSKTKVLETRSDRDRLARNLYLTTFRRRQCLSCNEVFNTTEVYEDRLLDYDLELRAKTAERELGQLKAAIAKLLK